MNRSYLLQVMFSHLFCQARGGGLSLLKSSEYGQMPESITATTKSLSARGFRLAANVRFIKSHDLVV